MENTKYKADESCTIETTKADENTPIITKFQNRKSSYRKRCSLRNVCISSNSALLILLWSFLMSLFYNMAFYPDSYSEVFFATVPLYVSLPAYGVSALVMIFYPLAGFLGDVKCGRFKIITKSLKLTIIGIMTSLISAGIITGFVFLVSDESAYVTTIIIGSLIMSLFYIAAFCSLLILLTAFISFRANVIQFGMDQLHDSPAQDSSSFIHWYIWVFYTSMVIAQIPWLMFSISFNWQEKRIMYIPGLCIVSMIMVIVVVLLIISLRVVRHRQRWFLIEPGLENPYKKVYRVTKFARQHKIPVRRSAFTYCEDEIPLGLDLGKEKYGGPFTTEQVEDVKAFYGILKVLFSIGPAFALETATNSMLPFFAYNWFYACTSTFDYGSIQTENDFIKIFMINNSLLSPLLIAVLIPLYLCFFRRIISPYIPGMLKRMGIGMILNFPSLLCFMVVAIITTKRNANGEDFELYHCYNITNSTVLSLPLQDTSLLIIHYIMSAFSRMLLYIGMFEFICAQSPHSMKGLLIGLSYAIKGLFQLLAVGLAIPFVLLKHDTTSYMLLNYEIPGLGYGYYITNLALGTIAFIMYAYTAWKYKYRVRDEPSKERQYAEDYYSNIQEEPNYD